MNSCETDVRSLVSALKECSRSRDLNTGKQLHSQALYSGHLSNKYVTSSLISLYSKCGSMSDARAVFDNLRHPHPVPLNALLHGYIDNGLSKQALEVFNERRRSSFSLNASTFAAAITACASLAAASPRDADKWMQNGEVIHSQAVHHGSCDMLTETALITLYARCGRMKPARQLFERMAERDVVSWNALLQGYVDNGEHDVVLELLERMEKSKICIPNARTYVAALTALAAKHGGSGRRSYEWLAKVEEIHSKAVKERCCDRFVENMLIDMYAKSGSMSRARGVFEGMTKRDVVSWTSLVHGYVDNGEFELALELFDCMDKVSPVSRTYVAALKACACLGRRWREKGENIHSRALQTKCCDIFVENSLMDVYVKHGDLEQARAVLDRMVERDAVTYNTMLQGYIDSGDNHEALELFRGMEEDAANSRTYALALAACAGLAAESRDAGERNKRLKDGETVSSQALQKNLLDVNVETALLHMYVRSGRLSSAEKVFGNMERKTVLSWNALMQGYAEKGENRTVLDLFARMEGSGTPGNSASFVHGITACGNILSLQSGKLFHFEALRRGSDKDTLVSTSLVDFYGRCGCMDISEHVFESIVSKDIVAWNAFLSGFTSQGNTDKFFEYFEEMRELRVLPNEITFLCVLTCCSHAGLTSQGEKFLQAMISVHKLSPGVKHYACMVDLYGRANKLDKALEVVKSMPVKPNVVVWQTLLGACTKWNNLTIGKLAYESLRAGHKVGRKERSSTVSQTWWTHEDGTIHRFTSGKLT